MRCRETVDAQGNPTGIVKIIAFPPDIPGVNYDAEGLPTQADQAAWTMEYSAAKAAEDAQLGAESNQRAQDLAAIFPDWKTASDAIDAAFTGAQRTIIKRLARVVYWLIKNKEV